MDDEQKERQFAEFRDAFIRDLPSEHKDRWGEVVFGEFSKTYHPILLLGPFDVPPVIREKWFEKYKRLKLKDQLSKLPYVGYFYGQNGEDTCYSMFSTKRLVDYRTGCDDDELPKSSSLGPKTLADVEKELEKDPKDRGRGMVTFVEDFKIPSFGLCHDLIASSTIESISSTNGAGSEVEDEDDVPVVRDPAKIFRSFGRYHIIQTKILNGKTGGLTLHRKKIPRVLSRALKSVFTSIQTQHWNFELGSDAAHGIESGDIFIIREDGQWHMGTPVDFREILLAQDCTVYLLRRAPQQMIEEEMEEKEKRRVKRRRNRQKLKEEKQPAKTGRKRKLKDEDDKHREEKRPIKRGRPPKIKEELSVDASKQPSLVSAPNVASGQSLAAPTLNLDGRQSLASASSAVICQTPSDSHAIHRQISSCDSDVHTFSDLFQDSKKGHLRPSAAEIRACATDRAKNGLVSWYKRYNELVDFREEHGHSNVPQIYKPNPSLGIWVNKMRMQKKLYEEGQKTSSLNEEKIQALEDIDFDWGKRKGDVLWEEKFQELLQYKKEFGNCHVPIKWNENRILGRWVSTQRKEYKNWREGKRTLMTDERRQKLEAAGFAWVGNDLTIEECTGSIKNFGKPSQLATLKAVTEPIIPTLNGTRGGNTNSPTSIDRSGKDESEGCTDHSETDDESEGCNLSRSSSSSTLVV